MADIKRTSYLSSTSSPVAGPSQTGILLSSNVGLRNIAKDEMANENAPAIVYENGRASAGPGGNTISGILALVLTVGIIALVAMGVIDNQPLEDAVAQSGVGAVIMGAYGLSSEETASNKPSQAALALRSLGASIGSTFMGLYATFSGSESVVSGDQPVVGPANDIEECDKEWDSYPHSFVDYRGALFECLGKGVIRQIPYTPRPTLTPRPTVE